MSKKTDKKNKDTGSSSDITKYILIAVIIGIASYFVYTTFLKKDETFNNTVAIDPREKIKNVREPQFKKEGELEFLRSNGKDTIRKIDIELAENDDERMQGLMYRRSMDDTRGMLFIFPNEEPQSFWMKNTVIPLDIIYVNYNKEIIKIYKSTTPFSENSLPSGKPATYVVEVSGGYTDRYGIKEGDRINFSKQ